MPASDLIRDSRTGTEPLKRNRSWSHDADERRRLPRRIPPKQAQPQRARLPPTGSVSDFASAFMPTTAQAPFSTGHVTVCRPLPLASTARNF